MIKPEDYLAAELRYYRDGILPNAPVFALYDVIADCFLTVVSNENIVKDLKYLVSSRYHLHVCRLDTASNYTHGMITNKNCEQWSLINRNAIRFSDPISTTITPVVELCATREVPQYNVFLEKLWCLLCTSWLYPLNNEYDHDRQHYSMIEWQYTKLDDYLNSFLNIHEVDYPRTTVNSDTKNKILKLLYLGRDFLATEAAIQQLINTQ
jgi:hypothetical protein